MVDKLIYTFLISISSFCEARAGIPYAILQDVPFVCAFLAGISGNLLIYPIFMWLIETFNKRFWPNRTYRKGVVKLSKRAKKGVGANVEKYGFWALMLFVMILLPGTGAYIGTVAAYVLKIGRLKAFWSISMGVLISWLLMALGAYYGNLGWELR